jgi:hypothetical protein
MRALPLLTITTPRQSQLPSARNVCATLTSLHAPTHKHMRCKIEAARAKTVGHIDDMT